MKTLFNRYHYATVKAEDLCAIANVVVPEGSYVSEDPTTIAVRDLLVKGYRWVRTDGEWAVFEKEMLGRFDKDIFGPAGGES